MWGANPACRANRLSLTSARAISAEPLTVQQHCHSAFLEVLFVGGKAATCGSWSPSRSFLSSRLVDRMWDLFAGSSVEIAGGSSANINFDR
jgi:hypothetical protein